MSGASGEIRERALALLARREHSGRELTRKLTARGFDSDAVDEVLASLRAEGLQSDSRFSETWIQHRIDRGYGPLRIRQELRERGIADELAETGMEQADVDWAAQLQRVRQKRFGAAPPRNLTEQARQSRFLHSRGFGGDDIARLFRDND